MTFACNYPLNVIHVLCITQVVLRRYAKKEVKMSKNLWDNDEIQFARLIAEAEAAGAFSYNVLEDMAESMDLSSTEVATLIDRAQSKFDKVKNQMI